MNDHIKHICVVQTEGYCAYIALLPNSAKPYLVEIFERASDAEGLPVGGAIESHQAHTMDGALKIAGNMVRSCDPDLLDAA